MAFLIVQSGKHQGKKLVLPSSEVTIGRDKSCQIRLNSDDVSRKHCVLRATSRGILVRDLGSRNGTLINDILIEKESLLHPGDMLRIGPMLFSLPDEDKNKSVQVARPSHIDSASDEDIGNWLAGEDDDEDDETSTGLASTSETTIITGRLPQMSAPKPAYETHRRDFKSIAEEAAYVIQKHWAHVRQKDDEQNNASSESQ